MAGTAASGLEFTVDGEVLRLRPFTGQELVDIALAEDWREIFPRGCDEDSYLYVRARGRSQGDRIGVGDCRRIAFGLAEELYRVPWWAAVQLCQAAEHYARTYRIWCISKGFVPAEATADDRCYSVLCWVADSCEDRTEWARREARIFTPPPAWRDRETMKHQAPAGGMAQFREQLATMGEGD